MVAMAYRLYADALHSRIHTGRDLPACSRYRRYGISLPDEDGRMDNSWAIHQLYTTTNFANNSNLFSWYVGGLNFQIEHHLFPNVCHVHYRKIAKIVKETAHEFDLPYKSEPTFMHALWGHARLLKELGKKPVLQAA